VNLEVLWGFLLVLVPMVAFGYLIYSLIRKSRRKAPAG